VTLTVTDNDGATGSVTHDITVVAANLLATDAFNRTVNSGFGAADVGGNWQSVSAALASSLSVVPGTGLMTVNAGKTPGAFLNVNGSDTDSSLDFSLDKATTGTGTYVWLVARHHSNLTEYRLRVKIASNNAIALSIMKTTTGTDTALATATISGLTFSAGTKYTLRFSVSGTSTVDLKGKLWASAGSQPAAWQVTASDTSATIASGGAGVLASTSSAATNAPLTLSLYAFKVAAI
jgi:large repetitive protein